MAGGAQCRGQATVEWTAVVLFVALALLTAGFVATRSVSFGLGRAILEGIVCAIEGGCAGSLEEAYGGQLARIVREQAPNIVYERRSAQVPVDFRRCREVKCANGPDRAAEIRESGDGLPVTAYTHVIDRRPAGGPLYVQYWFYFPESFSGGVGRQLGPLSDHWPGFHPDDWEGVQLRIGPGGRVSARATAHGRYKNFIHSTGWGRWTGWYRVSGGSHAGHLVEGPTGERSTRAAGLRLIPIESIPNAERHRFEVSPPWEKAVYREPESTES
jgi:hypothetical protein